LDVLAIRKRLADWYKGNRRDLPWRKTRDPYAIWISEIMLQQTRVAAVIPYYQRFLARFPDVQALARAGEEEILALWSGLGYYSRARNMLKAARVVAQAGDFPDNYAAIRELPGIGDYTAAAIVSIAFDSPHAAVDGNVQRVAARISNNADVDAQALANQLLDRKHPGLWNQAVMELGAMVCLPREPVCYVCPIAKDCKAHRQGTQAHVPGKRVRPETIRLKTTLLAIRRRGKILITPSDRVKGFWDLPEVFRGACVGEYLGLFRHTILNRQYLFEVREGSVAVRPRDMRWLTPVKADEIPLSTTAKKALRCLAR
jgi:A/G-specific adenine glycosylase